MQRGAQLGRAAAARVRPHLRLDVRRFIALLSLAATASLLIPHPSWSPTDASWVPAFLVLTLLSIGLEFVAVDLPHGGTVSVATMGHIATILLVPAPFAALSVGSAVLVEELVHRRPLPRIACNVANFVLTISLASVVVDVLGDPRALIAGREHIPLGVMVVLVSLVYHFVNDVLTNAVVALATDRPLMYLIRANGRTTILAESAAGLVGVLFALIWIVEPLWTTLLAVPGAVIARALQYIGQLERETQEAVSSMAEVVDHRDSSTFHHSARVAQYAVAIARELDLDEELIELIEKAATVHDLGKIGVPDRILLKPGPLTREEQTVMWLHAEIGARILGGFRLFGHGAAIVRHHHESFDGTGYPDRLAGEAIPIGARVVAVADALDAMTSHRHYRRALPVDEMLRRFRVGSGRQWDPVVVEAMLDLVETGRLDLDASRLASSGPDLATDHHDADHLDADHHVLGPAVEPFAEREVPATPDRDAA